MNESGESEVFMLPPSQGAAVLVQPGEQPFYLPSALGTPQLAAILGRWAGAARPVRRNQFNSTCGKRCIERIRNEF